MEKKKKKIIFLIETTFNQRDYKRFGIEILQKNGFDIQIWDLTPFLFPEGHNEKSNDPIALDICVTFTSLNDFRDAASKLGSNHFIICFIAYQLKSFSIYKILSKLNLSYCVAMNNPVPSSNKKPDVLYRIKNSTFQQKIEYAFFRIPYWWLGIKPASLILAGGKASFAQKTYPIDKKTKILWLHALDYDLYLEELKNYKVYDDECGVFVDLYLPFHEDFSRSGSPSPVTPDEYYSSLSKFFDIIEAKFGIRIIIAAHPRSRYEDHPDYFGGRPVIRGKTVELVRKSRFTITHNSTAVNFAILFHKPIIFITSNQLNQGWLGLEIESMASKLGKRSINLDEPLSINWEKELSINETEYLNYENNYIKKIDTQKLPFWQQFANYIDKYYNIEGK